MIDEEVSSNLANPPAKITAASKVQSPVLTKEMITKSLFVKKLGPRQGKMFVGKGGLKPYRKPADGTKVNTSNNRFRKPLRAPQQRKI